jgi:acetaldehyde dehydrogenase
MKARVAIVGSGNIGSDLMFKLLRSPVLEPVCMVGIDAQSQGLARARSLGLEVSDQGVQWLLQQAERPRLVFDATSAGAHEQNAERYHRAGLQVIDLTPAAIGPFVVPPVNLGQHAGEWNLSLVSCGGQATIPLVHAVSRVTSVEYAEIVASIASLSAGPGTRANIDEFTRTTAKGVQVVGGARRGKAIIILNPAEPPVLMRDTVICSISPDADRTAIAESVTQMVDQVHEYVPGYRLLQPPQFYDDRVVLLVEVEGAGDYLPEYAGNLDIMTASATRVGELLVTADRS